MTLTMATRTQQSTTWGEFAAPIPASYGTRAVRTVEQRLALQALAGVMQWTHALIPGSIVLTAPRPDAELRKAVRAAGGMTIEMPTSVDGDIDVERIKAFARVSRTEAGIHLHDADRPRYLGPTEE